MLGLSPTPELRRLLILSSRVPERLGPTAMGLFQDTLAKGAVLALARQGGWKAERGLRLWERTPAPPLHFTGTLFRFLQWMLRTPLAEGALGRVDCAEPFTPGEEVVVASVLAELRGSGFEGPVLRHPSVRASPLLVLAFAGELAALERLERVPALALAVHGPLLEGLGELVVQSWLASEAVKGAVVAPEVLRRIGDAQSAVLDSFLAQVGEARRLSGFMVEAGRRWLAAPRAGAHYGGALKADTPLGDRVAARRASVALVRALGRLKAWDAEHRAVRFIDDGYQEAQALIRSWEALGERGFSEAARLVAEVERLPGSS